MLGLQAVMANLRITQFRFRISQRRLKVRDLVAHRHQLIHQIPVLTGIHTQGQRGCATKFVLCRGIQRGRITTRHVADCNGYRTQLQLG